METQVWDAERRLRFAVEFAQRNLDHYRTVDWPVLREDLKSFLNVISLENREAIFPAESLDTASDTLLKEIQSDLGGVLSMFVGPPERLRGEELARWIMSQRPVKVSLEYTPLKGAGLLIDAPLRDSVLAITVKLLQRGETSHVVRCPICDVIFYRNRKQLFCSRTCTNRAMIRRKRQADLEKKNKKKKGAKKHGRQRSLKRR